MKQDQLFLLYVFRYINFLIVKIIYNIIYYFYLLLKYGKYGYTTNTSYYFLGRGLTVTLTEIICYFTVYQIHNTVHQILTIIINIVFQFVFLVYVFLVLMVNNKTI
ncbi:hypothetical protein C1645_792467 [Glomus cerebriforme]|uniref:Uncharacterized protein n=1 Tax=Glomus cerebriforme TaxID=658196 RepID=A0A397S242_9GLOM|nr:hypothetical protein C1645_793012 [Glomus cerebriforme]RIA80480.1 hypothetical protein C1645_792467 [Glomus cerebriforme]